MSFREERNMKNLLGKLLLAGICAGILVGILNRALLGKPTARSAQRGAPVEKALVNPPGLHRPSKWYTQVVGVRGGKSIYVSGQVSLDGLGGLVGRGDLRAQTVQAFRNLKVALAAAGATPVDVVQVRVYFVNYQEGCLAELEAGLDTCFGKSRDFASTVVGVQALAREGLLVEVEAVAVVH
jgi:enamine deaminase RidA (YjgF/YER057c/UK114 family)